MKNNRLLICLLIVLNIALLVVCSIFYFRRDKSAPKISFSADETVYVRGIDTQELTSCVTAMDNRDGDISDRVVIEKILENKEKNTAVVYYAVCDYSGNVTKASREYQANYSDDIQMEDEQAEDSEADNTEEINEEAESTDTDAEVEDTNSEDNQEVDNAGIDENIEENVDESKVDEAQKAEEEKKRAEEEAARAAAEAEAAKKAAVSPYIELKVKDVKVQAGSNVAWADVILTLRDDKDGYSVLFGNLVASKFDNNKKGDYTVTVYTTDSDKNQSNVASLIVHVV